MTFNVRCLLVHIDQRSIKSQFKLALDKRTGFLRVQQRWRLDRIVYLSLLVGDATSNGCVRPIRVMLITEARCAGLVWLLGMSRRIGNLILSCVSVAWLCFVCRYSDATWQANRTECPSAEVGGNCCFRVDMYIGLVDKKGRGSTTLPPPENISQSLC